jgi:RimJ/RimL family protein N-acetyltransferase
VIARLFERLSPWSRRMRFWSPMPRLPARMRDALVAVDGDRHVGWLAFAGDAPVGHVQLVRTGDGEAELGVMVADAVQRRGLGMLLLDRARAHAAAHGISRLALEVHPENAAGIALARAAGACLRRRDGALAGTAPATS